MGLKGQLEDLPLIDMLQIIAFSKKSGYLRVAGPSGRGAIVLREGRVLFAFSWSTMTRIREMAKEPGNVSVDAKRENIEAALRQLAGLREGSFRFELTDEISDELGGVQISPFMISHGLDPQELLLDLAVEIDNERRTATTLLELAFQGAPPPEDPLTSEHERYAAEALLAAESQDETEPEPAANGELVATVEVDSEPHSLLGNDYTVVVVDDEAPVTEVVGEELRARGYQVFTASGPGDGVEVIRACVGRGETVLAAIDLKMPTSSGESFYGGFELIRRLQKEMRLPVLLMVESLTSNVKDGAKALGVRRIVYKPTLTKPDPELYRADLREFTTSVEAQLQKLLEDRNVAAGAARDVNGADVDRAAFLSEMTRKLVEPGGSTDVSRLVLHVAQHFLERGVLFVVKSDGARGLAGFGFGANAADRADITRRLSLSLEPSKLLSEIVSTGKTRRLKEELESLDGSLFREIGRGMAIEGVWIPMLYNRVTLLLLYGDNGLTGRELGELGGLELFIAQAGMALENKLLQRKLNAVDGTNLPNIEQGNSVVGPQG